MLALAVCELGLSSRKSAAFKDFCAVALEGVAVLRQVVVDFVAVVVVWHSGGQYEYNTVNRGAPVSGSRIRT